MIYYLQLAATGAIALGCLLWYRKRINRLVAKLPGPPHRSWLVGNIPDFLRADNAAAADFEWTKRYGTAFRIKGCFGEDILYISDPKAIQHVLNSGYNFMKSWESRVRQRLTTGRGLISADGSRHARHRRVMSPSFSPSALRGYLPLFFDISQRTKDAWRATIIKRNAEASVIDVSTLLAHTTLDAIGEAAFGYKFNSIEGAEPKTELHKAYHNLFADVTYMRPDRTIVFLRVLAYAPLWLSDILTSYLPRKDFKRLKNYMRLSSSVAKDIVDKQMQAYASGKEGGKDVMSILVKANNAEDPKRRLEEDEILSQITTLMLAGHESTSNSLSWTLYELSRHPEAQRKLRDEIKAARAAVTARGESGFTISDLDSMHYMNAVLKESLRFDPIVIELSRRATRDDVIPLHTPQQTLSGETITAIPVRAGQIIQVGLASYNRNPGVWGQDADQWRPERFLGKTSAEVRTNVGVFGNLSTFGSGLRGCIGWRFAVIEMQVVLVDLIENFEFSPAPGVEIRRIFSGIMQSMVKGQEDKGTQLPLLVSIISRQDAH